MKKSRIIFLSISLFLLILQMDFLHVTIEYPYYGISVEKSSSNQWIVDEIDSMGINDSLDIVKGDRIVTIDGHRPDEYPTVVNSRAVELFHRVEIERNNEIRSIVSTTKNWGNHDIVSICGEVITLLIAFLIYKSNRRSPSAAMLSIVFLAGALALMSLGANVRRDLLAITITTSMVVIVPFLFYHFLVVFFKEKSTTFRLPRIHPVLLYFLPLCSILLHASAFVKPSIWHFIHENFQFTILVFLFGVLLVLFLLIKLYFSHRKRSNIEAMLIRTIWLSLFISFAPLMFFTMLPQLLGNGSFPELSTVYTGSIILFFPLSFTYLIATKQLYDIQIVIRRILIALLTALIPSALLAGVVLLVIPDLAVNSIIILFILFETVLTTLLYSMEYFTTKLEPIVFPRKHQLREAIGNVASKLGTITSFRELKDIILIDIVDTMQVHGGAIVFRSGRELETIAAGHIDTAEVERLIGATDTPEHPAYICLPVSRNEEYSSFLILTLKTTNTRLSREEIEWLNLIVSYLSISLENVYLIRKLLSRLQSLASLLPDEQEATEVNWFRKLMFELQEKERARIAGDLHDTTMQDLIFLKYRFEGVMTNYSLQPKDAQEIRNLLDYVEVITTNLRQSCFELHPYLLKDHGLVETVKRFVRLEAAVCSFNLSFDADGADEIERMDLDWKKHVFRICQEFISNAKKHAEASEVRLTLSAAGGTTRLSYEDDGVGFDPKEPKMREIGGSGFGMEQLRGRILMLGGKWELLTGKGEGVQFRIQFPMKGQQSA